MRSPPVAAFAWAIANPAHLFRCAHPPFTRTSVKFLGFNPFHEGHQRNEHRCGHTALAAALERPLVGERAVRPSSRHTDGSSVRIEEI
jgi:hypothetical protein